MKPSEIKINLKDDYIVLPFSHGPVIIRISESDFNLNLVDNTIEFRAKINRDKK